MKKKILWVLLSFLLVTSLMLASCAKEEVVEEEEEEEEAAVVEEEEEEEEEEEPALGVPQYGGTLTILPREGHQQATKWDFYSPGGGYCRQFIAPYLPVLIQGDMEKYGPRGTGEFGFNVDQFILVDHMGGHEAESWEWRDPTTLVFHIRQGVMWTGNANIGMEPREFTAYDAEVAYNHMLEQPTISFGLPWVESVYAEDKYTFVIILPQFYSEWSRSFAVMWMYAPETLEAGAFDWRNQVGTGPFVLKDYVLDSHAAYDRNPIWWKKTTVDGKEYDMPFVDELVVTIIPDASTQVAALRTAKLDYAYSIPLVYEETLTQSCPELVKVRFIYPVSFKVGFNCSSEIFGNREVRRALMVGTDLEAIAKSVMTEADIVTFPINSGLPRSIYNPLEDLPPSAQLLYDYNPTLARQMLADAGYAEGFEMELPTYATAEGTDIGSMLVDMWAKLNVKVTLMPVENVVISSWVRGNLYKDAILHKWGNNSPLIMLGTYPLYSWPDPYFVEEFDALTQITDSDEWKRRVKELSAYYCDEVPAIGLPNPYALLCYWPWLKNYYNETELGFMNTMHCMARVWIDQDLRAELGY